MRKTVGVLKMFSVGAIGYGIIELLWRGYTHWSMLTAGGICFVLLGKLYSVTNGMRKLYRCILGSSLITAVELAFGIIFNVIFKMKIWDYSRLPFNFCGQICLLYSVLWGFLCVPFMPFANKMYNALVKKDAV